MEKTQIGWVFLCVIPLITAYALFRHPGSITFALLSVLLIVILLFFYKLTIRVDEEGVRFSMGIGLINGKYYFEEIKSCRPIQYFPFGWGVRFRPGVTLYNVSGRKAVELEFKHKRRKIWIGTDAPEELSVYINEQLKSFE